MFRFVSMFALNLGLDAVGAWLVTHFSDDANKIGLFFICLLAIVLVQWGVAIWAFVKGWAFYLVSGKETASRYYLAEMNRLRMPPTAAHFQTASYLENTMADRSVGEAARFKAAIWYGELQALKSSHALSLGPMADAAMLDAMGKYRPTYYAADFDQRMVDALADELKEP